MSASSINTLSRITALVALLVLLKDIKATLCKAINKVLLAFNSALLCAFSLTLVGGIVVSLPSTSFVTIEIILTRYTKIDINYAIGGNLRRLSAEEAWETIEDCAQYDKQWKNPTSTISDQTIANSKAQLVENEVVRVMIPKCMSWLDAYDDPIGDMEDKEDNLSPQRIPMEVEPLDHTKLEDLGLNTCSHDLFLSSREIPSVDELEP
ncbi:hypothetical protein Tco_1063872 [Tanacetum coccineum]